MPVALVARTVDSRGVKEFRAGDVVKADEVNVNFEALRGAINDNQSQLDDLDGRIGHNKGRIDGLSGGASWPDGSYCVIQAARAACPAGFGAVNPGGTKGVIYGGSSSGSGSKKQRAKGSGGEYTSPEWAFCCK